ncbi:MAG: winged helix-turn-helix domain-containing protein [Myxococcota bacterium]
MATLVAGLRDKLSVLVSTGSPSLRGDAGAEALRAVLDGRLSAADPILAALADGPTLSDRAWAAALQAHRSLAVPEQPAPALETLVAIATPENQTAILWAALGLARRAMLAFDGEAHASIAAFVNQYSDHPIADLVRAWDRLLYGDGTSTIHPRSSPDGSHESVLRIEWASLQAEGCLRAGELEQATKAARRASRMARTEALPQSEYLAHGVLARTRRFLGESHRATRILMALASYAPRSWHRWIAWELSLSAGAWPLPPTAPRSEETALLGELRQAALASDRVGFDAVGRALLAGFDSDPERRREVGLLISALDPNVPVGTLPASLRPFALGASHTVPRGLQCFASGGRRTKREPSLGWVVLGPTLPPRRVLEPGVSLLSDVTRVENALNHGRTELGLSRLALVGNRGLAEDDFFRQVYGFDYERGLHEGVFRVLLHRMRALLGDAGELRREAPARIRLVPTGLLAIPDPTTTAPVSERLLRILAARPGASAADIAGGLGLPKRTVQAQLKILVQDGACSSEKVGPHVGYLVEDTTFSEPTDYQRNIL